MAYKVNADSFTASSLAEMVSTQTLYNESTNPYVLYGDGWVPDHIEIVSRGYYTFLAVYMTVLSILSFFLNGAVIVATIKYKVNFIQAF